MTPWAIPAWSKIWAWLRAAGGWIKKYWYIPVTIIGAAVMYAITRRPEGNPVEVARVEVEAIQAGAEAAKQQAELSTARATEAVKLKYTEKMEALDEKQREQAQMLAKDPPALAKFLVRAGRATRRI